MHKVVRQTIQKMPAPMKAKVKTTLWSLFAHFDDSFQANTFQGNTKTRETTLSSLEPARPTEKNNARVVVVNEQAILSNPDILRLTLCAVFQSPELSSDQESVYQYLCENPQLLVNHDALVAGLRSYLIERSRPERRG